MGLYSVFLEIPVVIQNFIEFIIMVIFGYLTIAFNHPKVFSRCSRNRKTEKTVTSEYGEVNITVPRNIMANLSSLSFQSEIEKR